MSDQPKDVPDLMAALKASLDAAKRKHEPSTPFEIDGFVICDQETGEPIDLIACSKNEPSRERVEHGLAMRIDFERFYFFDTRWTS